MTRKLINVRVGSVKRLFRWAVVEEIVAPEQFQRLSAVEGLRAGRTEAPDRPPVRPAVWADVEKALPHMPPMVRALVEVQVCCGARAGELVKLRVGDIDRTNPAAWSYNPKSHKGTWRGKARTIYFGTRSQAILAPLLLKAGGAEEFIFSASRSEESRNTERTESRKTPLFPSHLKRNKAKKPAVRKRPPGGHYTTRSYRRAVERACEKAGVQAFGPHRLRHLAATRTRAELGLDVARALLGHSMAAMTEHYSRAVDAELALRAVEKFG